MNSASAIRSAASRCVKHWMSCLRENFWCASPGKGTFVAEKKIQRKLDGVLSYTNMCYMMGYQPGAKTIKITLEQPTEEERGQLGLKKDEQTLVVERLRLADGRRCCWRPANFRRVFSFCSMQI